MKILILQNISDSIGGVANVNLSLAKALIEKQNKVAIYALRNCGEFSNLNYPFSCDHLIINEKDLWDFPTLESIKKELKNGNFYSAMVKLFSRKLYRRKLRKDYDLLSSAICKYDPDIIINSHYELLDAIPKKYYSVTINHYHTTFQQLKSNQSQKKIISKYNGKIARFLWLSEATSKQAENAGVKNCTYIYNPISFISDTQSSCLNKRIVFLGRISEEKRLDLLLKMFLEIIKEYGIEDWFLDIYGIGELDASLISAIESSPYVSYLGSTKNPKEILCKYSIMAMTSSYEGFALAILEANECGVPCIAFDFSESLKEEIIHNKTGMIIPQNNEYLYKKSLYDIMISEKKRVEMGKAAKTFAKNFHIDVIGDKWIKLFEDIRGENNET